MIVHVEKVKDMSIEPGIYQYDFQMMMWNFRPHADADDKDVCFIYFPYIPELDYANHAMDDAMV
jgi:hypothetical protein